MPNNLIESYASFKKAYQKLVEFTKADDGSEMNQAAIIHAYEYTFELWWKTLQRYLQDFETVSEFGPGATIRNAFQYGLIEEGQNYMDLLKDRNLIAYVYKENIALEIYQRIVSKHIHTLQKFIEKFDTKIL